MILLYWNICFQQKKRDEEALKEYNEAVKFGLQEDQSLRSISIQYSYKFLNLTNE